MRRSLEQRVEKSMTVNEFLTLKKGQMLLHTRLKDKSGRPQRWKVVGGMHGSLTNGSARWPIRWGMFEYAHLTIKDIALFKVEGGKNNGKDNA
jgi:hypothetical protein